MNACHAPNRCDARAVRLAQVKFVALPMELEADTAAPSPDNVIRGQAPSGALYLRTLVVHIIRVIGRLEAARP